MKILIVDDDAGDLLVVHRQLIRCDVQTAMNDEQLNYIDNDIDILICDLFLWGGMSARMVLEKVKENNSNCKTILYSGIEPKFRQKSAQFRDAQTKYDYVAEKTLGHTELLAILKRCGCDCA